MKQLEKMKRSLFYLLLVLAALAVLTACGSKAAMAADKIELGQKYLTELNYTEAIASFTEAIKLDPNNIQAYMGRAEAYLALGEYDKALEDYQFVSNKTEKMPYTRALSYVGQAEVYEKMNQPTRAIADYGLAKALLRASDAGQAEDVSEEDVGVKLVQVLYAHAALCETLKNYNTALEDYNDLLELGEKVDSKRDEILSQLGESIEEENGLLGTEADKVAPEPDTEEPAAESAAEKPTEEPATEQETSSASESKLASEEAKPEESASSPEQTTDTEEAVSSQEETSSKQETSPLDGEKIENIDANVETMYTAKSKYMDVTVFVKFCVGERSVKLNSYNNSGNGKGKTTYYLSEPLQAAGYIQKGNYGHIVFRVPEGTVITTGYSYEQDNESGQFDIAGTERFAWIETGRILTEEEVQRVNDADVKMEACITVRKNKVYQMVGQHDWVSHMSWVSDDGGIIFCAQ